MVAEDRLEVEVIPALLRRTANVEQIVERLSIQIGLAVSFTAAELVRVHRIPAYRVVFDAAALLVEACRPASRRTRGAEQHPTHSSSGLSRGLRTSNFCFAKAPTNSP